MSWQFYTEAYVKWHGMNMSKGVVIREYQIKVSQKFRFMQNPQYTAAMQPVVNK